MRVYYGRSCLGARRGRVMIMGVCWTWYQPMSARGEAAADDLLRQARQGDQSALGLLLDRYRNYLTLLAQLQIGRRLQRKFDPADVVQEAFLRAHTKFSQFQGLGEAELVAWMRQILASRLAKLIRHYWGTRGRD